MVKAIVIIPSRIGSTRLKDKPLIDLLGKSLVQRVYEGAKKSKLASKVIVATDSQDIIDEVKKIGGECVMTPEDIQTGTDRVAYVANNLKEDYDIIVNVQGDQPFTTGEMVDQLIEALDGEEEAVMSTLKVKFKDDGTVNNPNFVKVVSDKDDYAIYFSRSVIPYNRDHIKGVEYWWHLGYYAYRKDFLPEYAKMQQTPLETTELLEQLRVLENGFKIKVVETSKGTIEINTPEDIKMFVDEFRRMESE